MRKPLKIMISAGDVSGDHHAAAVLKALKKLRPDLQAFGLGGPALQAAGLRLDVDLVSRSVIGLVEVFGRLGFFLRAMATASRLARQEQPDLVLLVDSSGFNLRLAKKLTGFKIAYYICPQVWASRPGRMKVMARTLAKALVTFPFEKKIYDAAGLPCAFVGNPLLDALPAKPRKGSAALRKKLGLPAGPLLGLLPGSRAQEVKGLLPVMLASAALAAEKVPGLQSVVFRPYGAPEEWYEPARQAGLRVFQSENALTAYDARAACDAALVASGTATLETALLGVPFAILYRVNPITFAIAKRLVTLHSIGLANVVAGRRVVREFLQGDLVPADIAAEAVGLLQSPAKRAAQARGLAAGLRGLGKPGVAQRTAKELLALAHAR
jgi:lipid-A-disaccharide synthase